MSTGRGKSTPFQPHSLAQAGDVITNANDGGWHVVIKDHITGEKPPAIGESNDLYHFTVGPSTAGKM